MKTIVTFEIPLPDLQGYRRVTHEMQAVPDVGETVTTTTQPDGYLGEFVVLERTWRVIEEGADTPEEAQTQAIVSLEEINSD